eukprot:CAMPEP_0206325698 /NCGR_PEP_ID=MMETSP0106_2-20121207/21214_1 /ASSEMBLY_ACC=CAM_ASM_000206 /TAXON_ID=81532 /ORGANISM="Acanthoeca-like sp., Strain 10tr" /LENGTH=106 /DNA_ID=CAMNT_0053758187 /DNA_START=245 /DNA_END=565 /DNA_ORIENTATION=+
MSTLCIVSVEASMEMSRFCARIFGESAGAGGCNMTHVGHTPVPTAWAYPEAHAGHPHTASEVPVAGMVAICPAEHTVTGSQTLLETSEAGTAMYVPLGHGVMGAQP